MMRRCAVIADVVFAGYHFPKWVEYYAKAVGAENIFIFTYGDASAFDRFGLGRVTAVGLAYNNITRTAMFNELAIGLLKSYDVVVRVDIDEFIIPDPRIYRDLSDYFQVFDQPYITALGLDVVEVPGDDMLVYEAASLLSQRSLAVKSAAYSKTCVIQTPVRWHFGFHAADVPPRFDDLYLFHLKFSDLRQRLLWLERMRLACAGDEAHQKHFENAKTQLMSTRDLFYRMPVDEHPNAFRNRRYQRRIEQSVQPPLPMQYHYRSLDGTDDVLVLIPDEFRSCF